VRVNHRRANGAQRVTERGFTLLELLLVVAIIAILGAIAIPQFVSYRQTAFDARAKSDLRNAANAEEAYFVATGDYLDCVNTSCISQLPDFRLSDTVTITMTAANGAQPTFTGTAYTSSGNKTFLYDSAAGGMVY
jgi:prepilin-type N-terminal cleavage/methylation domain-containing protein